MMPLPVGFLIGQMMCDVEGIRRLAVIEGGLGFEGTWASLEKSRNDGEISSRSVIVFCFLGIQGKGSCCLLLGLGTVISWGDRNDGVA